MTRIVLLGLKGHQSVCLQEIARREDVRLVAVTDDDPNLLLSAPNLPGVRPDTLITPHQAEVLALPNVDVAIVCGDNGARARDLLACAQRGWHLCAEKPLALDLHDLDKVRAAVAAAKVRLTMLLTMRFEGVYRAARQALAQGVVGKPLQLAAQKSYRRGQRPAWQRQRATYGGTIPFIGIHPVDMLAWLTGCRYRRVAALAHNAGLPGAGQMEESCALLLETTEGAVVSIRLDYLRPNAAPSHGDDRFRIAGSTGVLEVIDGKLNLITHEQKPSVLPAAEAPNLFGQFLDALAGKGTHDITAEQAFAMTAVCLRAQEAAVSGRWVELA